MARSGEAADDVAGAAGGGSSGRWRPVHRARASDAIVEQIREALFQGAQAGQWLGTERELADAFEVSRTTVRDAVRTLEASGVVTVHVGAKGGIRIAQGDPDRFADALAVQLALVGIDRADVLDAQTAIERVTVERAARLADEEDLARLRALLEEAEATVDDPERNTDLSIDFHLAIAAASKNEALQAFLKALRGVLRIYYRAGTTPQVSEAVLAAHRELYELIAAGDGEAAEAKMAAHLHDVQVGRHAMDEDE